MLLKLYLLLLVSVSSLSAVQVKVEQGLLEGDILETVDCAGSYYSFKGIPYAAPPIGDLRFKGPQPHIAWEGVRSAKEHGAVCPQNNDFTGVFMNTTEDCLFLNVYTPNLQPETPLPVMFYIHGGGYKFNSGDETDLGPDFIVTKDVIVVTFNYRLDALGYLCLDTEEVPGNAGSKDQVAALRWVVANIANFGGDPSNITIIGHSTGSSSVGYFLLSPITKGLFKRAIMMSGTPLAEWTLPFHQVERSIALGKILGSNTNDATETYEFLKNQHFSAIINHKISITSLEESTWKVLVKGQPFTPVIEKDFGQERFLTDEVLELLDNGEIQDVDILFGRTSAESVTVASSYETWANLFELIPDLGLPRDIVYGVPAEKALQAANMVKEHYFGDDVISMENMHKFSLLIDDFFVNYCVNRFFNKLPESNSTSKFSYIYSALTERNPYGKLGEQYGVFGAGHQEELAYLFDPKALNLTLDMDGPGYQVIQSFTTLLTNFAKYGNPTPDNSLSYIWPEYTKSEGDYLDIGTEITVKTSMGREVDKFWRSVYEFAGIKY